MEKSVYTIITTSKEGKTAIWATTEKRKKAFKAGACLMDYDWCKEVRVVKDMSSTAMRKIIEGEKA